MNYFKGIQRESIVLAGGGNAGGSIEGKNSLWNNTWSKWDQHETPHLRKDEESSKINHSPG